ncbi:Crp/Fnr family transcriptional regulator [Pedobacter hartonius]|uniref:cAMP-binding domain of CRP or a regulatory subunit of cAMP-dependent protein kinases n=1 Tax=Pedobacter hartonius TaxID=425514 RepID=A0A1H4BSC3_9SPHI|nr:Crp/Fnr family transcriptional regulator [Pedobacter hartonius]SEA51021.1 cAMP-binding domain of CRP or a regulatory subunit of cAMP-dependent protein kinases [Pedobacter hartonius]
MHPEFETYLQAQGSLPPNVIQRISDLAVQKTLRRNESILNTGEICRHKIFVLSGMLRTFTTSADGSEHILLFSPEHNWTLDPASYDQQVPSRVSIGTVEPSDVLCWHKSNFDALLAEIPQFRGFTNKLISRNIYLNRERILTTLSGTAEEKYDGFVRMFPNYLLRLPLRMIASYLGISLKTLTRIRHAQLQRH